jgi:hypothetical protein
LSIRARVCTRLEKSLYFLLIIFDEPTVAGYTQTPVVVTKKKAHDTFSPRAPPLCRSCRQRAHLAFPIQGNFAEAGSLVLS